jgi:transcriptional regulator with XRE-family HTH domain
MVARKVTASSELIARLNAEMDSREMNQNALAQLLGISQGHLSKILSGKIRPGRRTSARMRELLDARSVAGPASGRWLTAIDQAARGSSAFKVIVNAALRLAEDQIARRKRRS